MKLMSGHQPFFYQMVMKHSSAAMGMASVTPANATKQPD
jgi:hypothetical protein